MEVEGERKKGITRARKTERERGEYAVITRAERGAEGGRLREIWVTLYTLSSVHCCR